MLDFRPMKRLLLAALIVLGFAGISQAQYVKVLSVAEQSGTVITSGVTSTTKVNKTFPGATVTIYSPSGSGIIASIFSASTGTAKANPFSANLTDATIDFYIAPGSTFDIRISGVSGGVTISAFTRSGYIAPGTTGISLALCGGTADTSLLSALSALGGTIQIPKGITCASNTQTISAALQIDNGGLLKPITTGQTLTLTGPQLGPVASRFTNATSGLGTISFAGNATLGAGVPPQWWVGSTLGAQGAAAIAALPSAGGIVDMRAITGTISTNMLAGVTKPITLLLGGGTYIVTAQQTYLTSTSTAGLRVLGSGKYATIIDNRVANGAAFRLDGSNGGAASNVYQRGAELRDFSITAPIPPPASSIGIVFRANHSPIICNVRIQGMSSHGIQIVNENGDLDGTAYLTMINSNLISNGGYNFHVANPVTDSTASGNFLFLNNEIIFGGSGGVRLLGLQWSIMGGTINGNTGYGLEIPLISGQTFNTLHVNDVEMEGNRTSHVFLEAAISATFDRVKTITSEVSPGVFRPLIGLTIGNGTGTLQRVEFNGTVNRTDLGGTTSALFAIASNALYTKINEFTNVGLGTVTNNITDAGTGTKVILANQDYGAAHSTVSASISSGTYTPDGKIGTHFITASGSFTLGAPTGAEDGREITIIIRNTSGGAITVTFNAVYAKNGYTDPGNGLRTSAKFQFLTTPNSWVQVNAWSPP